MRGWNEAGRWLLSRFGNCPRDRHSIAIVRSHGIPSIILRQFISRMEFPKFRAFVDLLKIRSSTAARVFNIFERYCPRRLSVSSNERTGEAKSWKTKSHTARF